MRKEKRCTKAKKKMQLEQCLPAAAVTQAELSGLYSNITSLFLSPSDAATVSPGWDRRTHNVE